MNDQELRLECLRIANTKYAAEMAVKVAAIYYEFAKGDPEVVKGPTEGIQEVAKRMLPTGIDWEAVKRKVLDAGPGERAVYSTPTPLHDPAGVTPCDRLGSPITAAISHAVSGTYGTR